MSTKAPHGKGSNAQDRAGAISCDVLDAWFDPSPMAIEAFATTGLTMRSSPEVDGLPLVQAISEVRGVPAECICLGAGSSELIHRVLPGLMGDGPAVLLDPTYSEYPFLLSREGIDVRRVTVTAETGFRVSMPALLEACDGASLAVLVNPNSPTGMALSRDEMLRVRAVLPPRATVWVDETYVDFAPPGTSVEQDAAHVEGLYVLKSLSKAYALSGIRAAYLVCAPGAAAKVQERTPPWIIGTSAMAAAVAAVRDVGYYGPKWAETGEIVRSFALALEGMGLRVTSGHLGAVLVEAPQGRSASEWAAALAASGLIVRTPEGMGQALGDHYVRISVVEPSLMPRVLGIIRSVPFLECADSVSSLSQDAAPGSDSVAGKKRGYGIRAL